ncbi:hypothetical protein HanXRQr2_Chr02g0082111 [Helianthus annuus]|uniref:Uncharacterized protein n=1 Tax=Helianthus annuus TaxID=4232 RepID=A0A9K3JQB5_HELAN|nr:hypothetical protein HanXRQr2_Chr02g0082111 [Helianthus annuus]
MTSQRFKPACLIKKKKNQTCTSLPFLNLETTQLFEASTSDFFLEFLSESAAKRNKNPTIGTEKPPMALLLRIRSVHLLLQVVQNHDRDGGGRDGVGLIRGRKCV